MNQERLGWVAVKEVKSNPLRKAYYLLYACILVTKFKFLSCNPVVVFSGSPSRALESAVPRQVLKPQEFPGGIEV